MPGAVAEVLLAHAQRAAGGPVRVVLLARNAGDWWTHAIPDRVAQSPSPRRPASRPRRWSPRPGRHRSCRSPRGVPRGRAGVPRAPVAGRRRSPTPRCPTSPARGSTRSSTSSSPLRARSKATARRSSAPEDLRGLGARTRGRDTGARRPRLPTPAAGRRRRAGARGGRRDARDRRHRGRGGGGAERDPRPRRRRTRPARRGPLAAPPVSRTPRATAGSRGSCPTCSATRCWRAVLAESPSIARGLLDEPSPEQAQSVLRALDRAARAHDGGASAPRGELVASGCARCGRRRSPSAQAVGRCARSLLGRALAQARPRPRRRDLAGDPATAPWPCASSPRWRRGSWCSAPRARRSRTRPRGPRSPRRLDRACHPPPRLARVEEALGAAEEAVDSTASWRARTRRSYRRLAARCAASPTGAARSDGHDQPALDANEEAVGVLRGLQAARSGARLEFARHAQQPVERSRAASGASTRRWTRSRRRSSILEPALRRDHCPETRAELAGAYTNFSNRLDRRRARRGRRARGHATRPRGLPRASPRSSPTPTRRSSREALANVAVDLRTHGAPDEALAARRRRRSRSSAASTRRSPGTFLPGSSHALNSLLLRARGLRAPRRGAARERGGGRRSAATSSRAHPGGSIRARLQALHNLAIDLRTRAAARGGARRRAPRRRRSVAQGAG